MAKTSRRAFRLTQEKWDKFGRICNALGTDRSTELRRFVYSFIRKNKTESQITKETFWDSLTGSEREMASELCKGYAGSDGVPGRIHELWQEAGADMNPSDYVRGCFEMAWEGEQIKTEAYERLSR